MPRRLVRLLVNASRPASAQGGLRLPPRRPRGSAAALAAATVLLGASSLGLGGAPGSTPGKVPTPPRNFTAEVTDRQGVVTKTTHVSCGGEIFIVGKRGETTLTVGFDKVRRVRFGTPADRFVEATVETTGGETVRLRVETGLTCAGLTEFGTVQVAAGDLQMIVFTGEVRR